MEAVEIYEKVNHIPGWFSFEDITSFANLPMVDSKELVILELGTYHGRSSVALRMLFPTADITTCDTQKVVDTDLMRNHALTFIHSSGTDLPWKKKIDLLFVDDSHETDQVMADIEQYLPLVRAGGYIVFHDYYGTGVKVAVDTLLPGGTAIKTGEFSQYIYKKEWNIPFCKPTIGKEEIEATSRVLRSGWLAAGKETEAFEREFSTYISPPGKHYYCIFTNSCTSALKMSYKWAKENSVIWIGYPKNTFCATYSAAEEMGLLIKSQLKDRFIRAEVGEGFASVNVHYAGIKDETPCLIEDSAHRIEPNDPLVGKIRCYSFYATKNMTTGSGGMFVTNDKDIYERARLYWRDGLTTSTADRLNGIQGYRVEAMAGGYDGNDIAAAMGRVQLRKLPTFTQKRNDIRDYYNAELNQDWQGNHLYPWFVKDETEAYKVIAYLKEKGIAASHHYPGTGWNGVSLPIYPLLTREEQEYIIQQLKAYDRL